MNKRDGDDSSTADSPPKKAKPAGGITGVDVGTIYVLNNTARQLLPVKIHPELPHVKLTLGKEGTPLEICPMLSMMADSCAACKTMRLQVGLDLVRAYPHTCKAMIDCQDGKYSPLKLAGVVSDDDSLNKLTTDLPVLLEFYVPYSTKEGEPLTVSFACGTGVAVNAILGLPCLKTDFGMALDLKGHQGVCQNLSCDPFDIFYKVPVSADLNLPKKPVRCPSQDVAAHVTEVLKGECFLRNRYFGNPGGQACAEAATASQMGVKIEQGDIWGDDHQG